MRAAVQDRTTREHTAPEWSAYRAAQHAGAGQHAYISLLGLKFRNILALHQAAGVGLSFRAFERIQAALDVPAAALSESIQIRPRTLQRRREAQRLEPDESDRLLRLARLFGMALELFEGDLAATRAWLTSPRSALGGAVPLELLRTDPGAREVENLIGRLEHGVVV